MIRTKDAIYGEVNDPNTVEASGTLTTDTTVVGAGNKGVQTLSYPPNRILIVKADGTLDLLDFNGLANKVIATDDDGKIVLIDRGIL